MATSSQLRATALPDYVTRRSSGAFHSRCVGSLNCRQNVSTGRRLQSCASFSGFNNVSFLTRVPQTKLSVRRSGCIVRSSSELSPNSPAGNGSKTVLVLQTSFGLIALGTIAVVATLLVRGGPAALAEAVTKSGFMAAFSLIFMSEIGDKTFFIAALLAMTHSKYLVLAGGSAALALMSVISVLIGRLFRKLPAQLQTTIPVGEYLAIALLLWFGLRNIRSALLPEASSSSSSSSTSDDSRAEEEEGGELAEAQEFVNKAKVDRLDTPWAVFREAFCLIFVAEWGDRSMLATIALGAAQSPVGVALGASLGHVIATGIAVLGGSLLAKYISEKLVTLISGALFVAFAAATYFGVF